VNRFNAVVTTGIYCRRGCAARPRPHNVRTFDTAAAAEAAGYRACLRCRPYRSALTVDWTGPELVCRSVQLILDGALDGDTEAHVAARLGVSTRHLRRLFTSHLGVTPDQLARSRRVHFARRLLDDTDLTITEIAFASGFGSTRQFNRACQEVFRSSPSELRARRLSADRLAADGGLVLRLPFDGLLDFDTMLRYLAARAIPGVEHVTRGAYRRTVVVDGDPGVLELLPGGNDHILLRAHLPHWEGLIHVVERVRRVFGLDQDPAHAVRHLAKDPIIRPLITARPGLRVPGTWDPFETAIRAIVGQQVSVAGATTIAGRLAHAYGAHVRGLAQLGLTHTFPPPALLADVDLHGLGLPQARASAIRDFARAVASDEIRLDRSMDLDELIPAITSIPGIGAWTAHYVAVRLGERDAFPAGDLGLQRALARLSDTPTTSQPELTQRWQPWRALAAVHLWTSVSDEPVRALPPLVQG
jgi:AraC family transcriptional regulator, regulatory protein of adaptative response / DNA-3-methyladenine glycosylase II